MSLPRFHELLQLNAGRELRLERATRSDADAIAKLYLASRSDALPYLPVIRTIEDTYAWTSKYLLDSCETWVARLHGEIVGFMALNGQNLEQLYLLPGYYRRGIGQQLLDLAKTRSPARLILYTFQRNHRARAFYEAQGFRIVDMTHGEHNEEKEPDLCFEWSATEVATR